jgi:16S rRNA (guanine527-N7)-methyltransferase
MNSLWQPLLQAAGIPWTEDAAQRLDRYLALVRRYNEYGSLVSQGDLALLESVHVPDSLSLAPQVHALTAGGGEHLDIGTGSGFPAIPLAIALPGLSMTLVERSTKKVGFLRQVQGALGLTQLRILQGEFPMVLTRRDFASITARAVERPEKISKALVPFIQAGSVFLGQSGEPVPVLRDMFHVEHIQDPWTEAGLRRGDLYRIAPLP